MPFLRQPKVSNELVFNPHTLDLHYASGDCNSYIQNKRSQNAHMNSKGWEAYQDPQDRILSECMREGAPQFMSNLGKHFHTWIIEVTSNVCPIFCRLDLNPMHTLIQCTAAVADTYTCRWKKIHRMLDNNDFRAHRGLDIFFQPTNVRGSLYVEEARLLPLITPTLMPPTTPKFNVQLLPYLPHPL